MDSYIATEDIEALRCALLGTASPDEIAEYQIEARGRLYECQLRVCGLVPDITEYSKMAYTLWFKERTLPEIHFKNSQEKIDFLLGSHWLLSDVANFTSVYGLAYDLTHNYNAFLPEDQQPAPTPESERHFQAALEYNAKKRFGVLKRDPFWPWPEFGNPFYE